MEDALIFLSDGPSMSIVSNRIEANVTGPSAIIPMHAWIAEDCTNESTAW